MKTIPKLNNCPKVVTSPTPANRSMNPNVTASLNPSNPNKKMNANVVVKPSK